MTGKRRRGYTLLEVMICVVIFAVLLAVAVPMISKARTTARAEKARAQLQMLASAVLQLAWDTGEWPGGLDRSIANSDESWDLNTTAAGLKVNDGRFANWKGPYHRTVSLDPWGKNYFFDPDYTINGRIRVVVGSFGPNKVGPNVYDRDDIVIILDTENN